MAISEENVLGALRTVIDPDLHKDLVTLGMIKKIAIDGGRVSFTVELTTPACPLKADCPTAPEVLARKSAPGKPKKSR